MTDKVELREKTFRAQVTDECFVLLSDAEAAIAAARAAGAIEMEAQQTCGHPLACYTPDGDCLWCASFEAARKQGAAEERERNARAIIAGAQLISDRDAHDMMIEIATAIRARGLES